MLQLNLSMDPQWLDLGHGVQILVEPMTTALMMAARKVAQSQIELPDTLEIEAEEFDTDGIALAMAKAVACIAIKDWSGVGDAKGDPVPVSSEGINALLDIWPLFEAFQTKYVNSGFLLDAEKNVSPPLLTGSSAGAAPIVKPARKAARTARKS